MQHIPPKSLSFLPSRQSYTLSFLSLNPHDGALINASAPHIVPLIPTVLDVIYTKLLSYDITAQAFAPVRPNNDGHKGSKIDEKRAVGELHLQHENILRRKDFLRAYLFKIAKNQDWSPESKIWQYMDDVAVLHTGTLPASKQTNAARGKTPRHQVPRVEYIHLGLLLAYVEELVAGAVMDLEDVDAETKKGIILAWNKLLWVQNDLFARRYVVDERSGERPQGWIAGKERSREREVVGGLGVLFGAIGMWIFMRMFV